MTRLTEGDTGNSAVACSIVCVRLRLNNACLGVNCSAYLLMSIFSTQILLASISIMKIMFAQEAKCIVGLIGI